MNRFGGPHNPAAVNRAIKRIVDAHNAEEEVKAKREQREPVMLPRFSNHIFRHTFASRFVENETNVKIIQEVMGHADIYVPQKQVRGFSPWRKCGVFHRARTAREE